MARFIQVSGGYINLDLVTETKFEKDSRGRGVTLFYDGEGRIIARSYWDQDNSENDIRRITAPVFAAAPGTAAIVIGIDTGNPTLSIDDIIVRHEVIVGWRVAYETAEPIFLQELCSDDIWLIEYPDKTLVNPDNRSFDSIEEAKNYVLEEHKRHIKASRKKI